MGMEDMAAMMAMMMMMGGAGYGKGGSKGVFGDTKFLGKVIRDDDRRGKFRANSHRLCQTILYYIILFYTQIQELPTQQALEVETSSALSKHVAS